MTAIVFGEIRKLLRQPAALIFGFFAVAIVTVLVKMALEGFTYLRLGAYPVGEIDLLFSAAKSMSVSGNTLGHLLYAIGIGTVFATEYRYSTWRLLVPRHPRWQLYAGKFLTCLLFLALSLVLAALGDIAFNLLRLVLRGAQSGTSIAFRGASAGLFMLAFLTGLLELAVLTAFVALVTTVFRTMTPAVILGFLTILGASLMQVYLGRDAEKWPLPSYCADFIRNWISSDGLAAQAGFGLFSLILWLVLLLALGAAIFERQELTSE